MTAGVAGSGRATDGAMDTVGAAVTGVLEIAAVEGWAILLR